MVSAAGSGSGDGAPAAQPPSGNVGMNDSSSNAANSYDNYWNEELEEDSSGSDYDMAQYDDDGGELVTDGGEVLIPFDEAKTYDEDEARDLRTFAATYQTVRGALQASRTGREQKT